MIRTDELTAGMIVVPPRFCMYPDAPPVEIAEVGQRRLYSTRFMIPVTFTDGTTSSYPVDALWRPVEEVVS